MEDQVEFNIKVKLHKRWINDFLSFLDYLEYCSNIGHSAPVGFYADGDGDFRFEFDTDMIYELTKGPDDINKNADVELLFDAG